MARARIIFFGTPDGVLPVVRALCEAPEIDLAAILTQPEKPKGRGLRVKKSALAAFAEAEGIPHEAPKTLRNGAVLQNLSAYHADCFVVFAYGRIVPKALLGLPRAGVLNVHPSLLPKYRGASPIAAAILNGDAETGISYMVMDAGMDTGPVLAATPLAIAPDDTAETLFSRAAAQAAQDLPVLIKRFCAGELQPKPQTESDATVTVPLSRDDGLLDFSQDAKTLARQVRAYAPWPGSFTFWNDKRIIVTKADAADADAGTFGCATVHEGFPAVQTNTGLLVFRELQMEGKPRMPGDAFLRGHQRFPGSRLGS
jgi:methionyl-tRNA formyltransferase